MTLTTRQVKKLIVSKWRREVIAAEDAAIEARKREAQIRYGDEPESLALSLQDVDETPIARASK